LVIAELTDRIESGLDADYITLSGSGEPTLNSQIGDLIRQIKSISCIPVAVITNGTLLNLPQVRHDLMEADVVLPSLDAGDEETFLKINCPHVNITLASLVEGLCAFREEYGGNIWLEVFFCEGVNSSDDQVDRLRAIIERISPDKVQVNTAVRPVVSDAAVRLDRDRLVEVASKLGKNVEIIADFSSFIGPKDEECNSDVILDMLRRRPCGIGDICVGLNISYGVASRYLQELLGKGLIKENKQSGMSFFEIT
jgi:wyosine [tRNA(Phe)-imidazoG37] synthetase (radical SAM superfamily)